MAVVVSLTRRQKKRRAAYAAGGTGATTTSESEASALIIKSYCRVMLGKKSGHAETCFAGLLARLAACRALRA
jgi:Flp pilus assembly CpaE family ATPase